MRNPTPQHSLLSFCSLCPIDTIHFSQIFAGFSAEGIAERIRSSHAKLVITADEMFRAGKKLPLKPVIDQALAKHCESVTNVLVVQRTGAAVPMTPKRDLVWSEVVGAASADCPPVAMSSQDPLFVLFTSGSTGKPKGLVHTTGGYLTYAATTFRYAFDIKPQEVFASMADVGWITGHTYGVYGSLTNGTTSLLFEGHPTFPHTGRYWSGHTHSAASIGHAAAVAAAALWSRCWSPHSCDASPFVCFAGRWLQSIASRFSTPLQRRSAL